MANENPMRSVYLQKLVLNIGIGNSEDNFQAAKALLKKLTGKEAIATLSKGRQPEFKIRKGQIVGAAVTLRGKEAQELLVKALDANGNVLTDNAIANNSLNFGIKEYIYFQGIKYDPKIGMLGLNVNASFARRGARVENRRRLRSRVKPRHRNISSEEVFGYLGKIGVKIAAQQ